MTSRVGESETVRTFGRRENLFPFAGIRTPDLPVRCLVTGKELKAGSVTGKIATPRKIVAPRKIVTTSKIATPGKIAALRKVLHLGRYVSNRMMRTGDQE